MNVTIFWDFQMIGLIQMILTSATRLIFLNKKERSYNCKAVLSLRDNDDLIISDKLQSFITNNTSPN